MRATLFFSFLMLGFFSVQAKGLSCLEVLGIGSAKATIEFLELNIWNLAFEMRGRNSEEFNAGTKTSSRSNL